MQTTHLKVPFLDLRVPPDEKKRLMEAVERVMNHGRFIIGPEVAELERVVAHACWKKFGVGMGSGTDALFLGIKALDIGPGDEVITTSLSWIATTNAIAMTGATLVFADIGDDLNIDPASVERLITSKTKAIVPVHFTGKICKMDELQAIAKKHSLYLVEDAAQAFGATYKQKPAGSFGSVACFSMNPMKVFAACGEAGMVLTDDEESVQMLTALRYNGTINKEQCIATSLNCRLDTIQASILLERIKGVHETIEKRRAIASQFSEGLSSYVRTPHESPQQKDVYYTYQIQTPQRDALREYLEKRGIETKIQYSILMCEHPIYSKYVRMPPTNSKRLAKEILCLPMHEKLTEEQVEHVIGSIRDFFS